jgi:hypothetical protein
MMIVVNTLPNGVLLTGKQRESVSAIAKRVCWGKAFVPSEHDFTMTGSAASSESEFVVVLVMKVMFASILLSTSSILARLAISDC